MNHCCEWPVAFNLCCSTLYESEQWSCYDFGQKHRASAYMYVYTFDQIIQIVDIQLENIIHTPVSQAQLAALSSTV